MEVEMKVEEDLAVTVALAVTVDVMKGCVSGSGNRGGSILGDDSGSRQSK